MFLRERAVASSRLLTVQVHWGRGLQGPRLCQPQHPCFHLPVWFGVTGWVLVSYPLPPPLPRGLWSPPLIVLMGIMGEPGWLGRKGEGRAAQRCGPLPHTGGGGRGGTHPEPSSPAGGREEGGGDPNGYSLQTPAFPRKTNGLVSSPCRRC